MAPGIVLDVLGSAIPPLRVLDPMAGSGTVLAVARKMGHQAVGVDLDPLAVLLAGVWTQIIDARSVRSTASEVLGEARGTYRSLKVKDAYPVDCDVETADFVRYWFDPRARRQLAALASAIAGVTNRVVRDTLWCAFSRLIITKQAGASLAMDLAHSRPHKKYVRAPISPLEKFESTLDLVVQNCLRLGEEPVGPSTSVQRGDARALPLADASIDLVLTSPPYLNAIDYMRCSKFSLVWMGHSISSLRAVRKCSVGTEAARAEAVADPNVALIIRDLRISRRLAARSLGLLSTYVSDMGRALSETARVLRPGGRAVYVIGDSTIRGTFVRNSAIVRAVAESQGLRLLSSKARALPENRRYLPPPRKQVGQAALDGRMRREVVLMLAKSGAGIKVS
jgi:SAM-dependent methyltransferase